MNQCVAMGIYAGIVLTIMALMPLWVYLICRERRPKHKARPQQAILTRITPAHEIEAKIDKWEQQALKVKEGEQ